MRKLALLAPLAVAALTLTACCVRRRGTAGPTRARAPPLDLVRRRRRASCGTTLDEITAAAKAEGQVNLIALPDTWANYKGILASFTSTYGIKAPVANPDASSADEVTAIQTLRGQPDMPDAVDVGPSFTQQMIDQGYADVYEPTVWDQIPDALKDPAGHWVAAYYGVMSIATNTTLVPDAPTTWADLKDPKYKGMVTLNGDPREAGAAFAAVMAASLANGGSFDDIMPGIQYFADLKASGNLQTIDVNEANLLSGEVPIALDWTYNFPAVSRRWRTPASTCRSPSRPTASTAASTPSPSSPTARTRARRGCGSSTSSATTARSATSRAARSRPATRRCSRRAR